MKITDPTRSLLSTAMDKLLLADASLAGCGNCSSLLLQLGTALRDPSTAAFVMLCHEIRNCCSSGWGEEALQLPPLAVWLCHGTRNNIYIFISPPAPRCHLRLCHATDLGSPERTGGTRGCFGFVSIICPRTFLGKGLHGEGRGHLPTGAVSRCRAC